jgi:hypothetical protein
MSAINETTLGKKNPTSHDVGDMLACRADMSGRHDTMSPKLTFGDISNGDISS